MSYLNTARQGNEDRKKARAYDGMKQQAEAKSIFSAGSAQGALDTQRSLEQALANKQQEAQRRAIQQAAYAKMDQDMSTGTNYRDSGPSTGAEVSAFMSRAGGWLGNKAVDLAEYVTGAGNK
jgi:hypothetical protein